MSRIGALELRDAVLDDGSFVSWDAPPLPVADSDEYRRELAAAEAATGLDESVHHRRGPRLRPAGGGGGVRVRLPRRLDRGGGGRADHRRHQRATAERLPLLASPSSGGTRMQEGTVAFLQMVKIAAAVELHKRAHLPYLVYLRHPTTGGVFASWGSLGHITVAEPGALVGFLGPRVYEHLYGEPFPSGVQTAENLQRHGVIDAVVPLDRCARHAGPRAEGGRRRARGAATRLRRPSRCPTCPRGSRWRRRGGRTVPVSAQLLRHGATERVLLSGTGLGEGATTLLALARFGGQPAVVLGQQRVVGWPRSGPSRCARPAAAWRWPPGCSCRWCW